MSEDNHTTVVIVGGGVAGLATAKELAENKINFILFEAQDYLGGRVRTIDANINIPIDLGAQYILGETNNLVHTICKQLNCIDAQDAKEDLYVLQNGYHLDRQLIEQIWEIREEILEDAREKSKTLTSSSNISLLDHIKENYKQRLTNDIIKDEAIRDALIPWLIKLEEVDIGCQTLSDVSLTQCDSSEQLDKSSLWKLTHGFRTFIDYLCSFIPKYKIRFNTEVTKVQFVHNKHLLIVQISNLLDGTVSNITCSHIIWTTSLGYLKENFWKIFASEPNLIHQKQNPIKNLGFGTVNKIVLIYDEPVSFWPDNVADLHPLRSKKLSTDLLKDEEIRFLTKNHVDPDKARFVLDGILCISPSKSMRFLIVWVVGEAALVAENFNEFILGYLCHNVFLCQYLTGALHSQKPSRTIMSYWNKNRFERGSYSYLSLCASLDDRDRLLQPYAPDEIPRVVFAGEATHRHHYSSVHGAFESGINAVATLKHYVETNSKDEK